MEPSFMADDHKIGNARKGYYISLTPAVQHVTNNNGDGITHGFALGVNYRHSCSSD